MSRLTVRVLPLAEVGERQSEFAALERRFVYPLGDDSFRIDHGADYLAFFRALGDPVVAVAEQGAEIVGVCVAVSRRCCDQQLIYYCDLKVVDGVAGRGLAARLVRASESAIAGAMTDLPAAAFGISMNPADHVNRMRRLAVRFTSGPVAVGPEIGIWSLSFEEWSEVSDLVGHELGPITFYDPVGIKDIVMASTGVRMPLLHAQHGPWARAAGSSACPGHVHMLCLPLRDSLAGAVRERVTGAPATATVLHRGLDAFDWRWLLSSEI